MAKQKYYAVRVGLTPGIYLTWKDCQAQVHGVAGAQFKSFPTAEEAAAYLGGTELSPGPAEELTSPDRPVHPGEADPTMPEETGEGHPAPYAFVDGSFHAAGQRYGYGGFLVYNGIREILQGSGSDPEMAAMRNVAGEILGSQAAIAAALERNLPTLRIYYDYAGIEMWATGEWKRNKAGTIAYYEYIQSVKDRIRLQFVKVKGHSGVEGNEEADRLAKEAVGII